MREIALRNGGVTVVDDDDYARVFDPIWEQLSPSSSSFKGVTREGAKFRARIGDAGAINLGLFETEIEAALAYDQAAKQMFGEFARPNFPAENVIAHVAEQHARATDGWLQDRSAMMLPFGATAR